MIDGHAIFQSMRAAGIGGDIASDRAGSLAAGIRGIMKAAAGKSSGQSNIDTAWFNDRIPISLIDFQNTIHFGQSNHDSATDGQTSSGQAGSGSARDKRHAELIAFTNDPDDFITIHREHDDVWRILFDDVAIAFVDDQFIRSIQQSFRPNDTFQPLQKCVRNEF